MDPNRELLMREALERARDDLVFVRGLTCRDGDTEPGFKIDVTATMVAIDAALDGYAPLPIEPGRPASG